MNPRFVPLRITLFADALYEAGSDRSELVLYFYELAGKLISRNYNVRICISCRKYPVIAPNVSFKIYIEEENREDIKTFVKRKFNAKIQSHSMTISARDRFKDLQMEAAERLRNTFQWASLVVLLINRLYRDGKYYIRLTNRFSPRL